MVTAHHLGGRRGGHIMCWGWEKKKWLALGAFRVSKVKNDGQTRFSTRFYVISTTSRIFSCPAVCHRILILSAVARVLGTLVVACINLQLTAGTIELYKILNISTKAFIHAVHHLSRPLQ